MGLGYWQEETEGGDMRECVTCEYIETAGSTKCTIRKDDCHSSQ